MASSSLPILPKRDYFFSEMMYLNVIPTLSCQRSHIETSLSDVCQADACANPKWDQYPTEIIWRKKYHHIGVLGAQISNILRNSGFLNLMKHLDIPNLLMPTLSFYSETSM